MPKTALVTGGNRGIGFEICRLLAQKGLNVILGARDLNAAEEAVEILKSEGLQVSSQLIDVQDAASIRAASENLLEEFGVVDVLVNNAGVLFDRRILPTEIPYDVLITTINTNTIGPFLLCQAFIPAMVHAGFGRVVNVSSVLGALHSMSAKTPAYSISKAGLNAVTRVFAAETQGTNVKVNSMHPGRVHTRMGSPDAPLTPQQGADTAVWLATLPDDGPTGGFFYNRQPLDW